MRICLFLCLLCFSSFATGQSVSPVVPDFTDISAPWVEATAGTYDNPFQHTGVVANRHTLITAPGTDPNTGGKLSLLPSGESRVVRLGNPITGAEAESISYRFVVDVEKSVLMLKFAVVLEDPAHAWSAQPRFVVRILNQAGELVESCSEYDVHAGPDIAGFQAFENFGRRIMWRDWTSVGLDLSKLAGQEVQVQFITYDCAHFGHYGYAYFTAECISNRLEVSGCTAPEVALEAPSGFASYMWEDGSTDPSHTVAAGAGDVSAACEVVSATGCRFTLSAFISSRPDLPVRDTILYDTICEGEEYHKNFYHLSARNEPGTEAYYNTFYNTATCSGDVTSTLFLTTLQRYYRYEANICQGEDYAENGFRILQPKPGVYNEKLTVTTETGCERVLELRLTVTSSPEYLPGISGDPAVCSGTVVDYEVPDLEGSGSYHWTVPAPAYIFAGQGMGKIRVQFTDDAVSGHVKFVAVNGCGQDSVDLPVTVSPSYHEYYTDSVCAGSPYSGYGFEVAPLPNETFRRTVTQSYKTPSGCDSIRSLELKVFNTPVVEIVSEDTLVCSGDLVSLDAWLKEGAGGVPVRRIHIGDVVCKDGSVLSPEAFMASGKQADGVVFYVGKDGESGTMVSLHTIPNVPFSSSGIDGVFPGMPYPMVEEALGDLDGYDHTVRFRDRLGMLPSSDAYAVVDLAGGWYIPALGELRQLFVVHQQVDKTLKLLHADTLSDISTVTFWSSTPCITPRDSGQLWTAVVLLGGYYFPAKATTVNLALRSVASFPKSPAPACVTINGVCWAECNVGAPGTFAATPESPGMFYQWGRKTGWPAAGTVTGWDVDPEPGDSWTSTNDPCPAGWRVPTNSELATLLETAQVTSKRTTQNGVSGMKFTDNATGDAIFFLATGQRDFGDGRLFGSGVYGHYWSGTSGSDRYFGWRLDFDISGASRQIGDRSYGFSVRCVRE